MENKSIYSEYKFGNVTIQLKSDKNMYDYNFIIIPSDEFVSPSTKGDIQLEKEYNINNHINRVGSKELKKGFLWINSTYKENKTKLGLVNIKDSLSKSNSFTEHLKAALIAQSDNLSNSKVWIPLITPMVSKTSLNDLLKILVDSIIDIEKVLEKINTTVLFNLHPTTSLSNIEIMELNKIFNTHIKTNKEHFTQDEKKSSSVQNQDFKEIQNKISAAKDRNFWWIIANQKKWKIEEYNIGEIQKYTTHTSKGTKRRIFENFFKVKEGDIAIGYQSPSQKIIALFEILSPAKNISGDEMSFKLIYFFKNQISRSSLLAISSLKNNPIFKRGYSGSLFKLTYPDFRDIINTTELGADEKTSIIEPQKEFVPTHRDSPAVIDILNRQPLADSLCNEIKEMWALDDPDNLESDKLYTIHIQGPWGSGKSTFLNLIEQNLTKKNIKGEGPRKDKVRTNFRRI